jgi:hypothetical protein
LNSTTCAIIERRLLRLFRRHDHHLQVYDRRADAAPIVRRRLAVARGPAAVPKEVVPKAPVPMVDAPKARRPMAVVRTAAVQTAALAVFPVPVVLDPAFPMAAARTADVRNVVRPRPACPAAADDPVAADAGRFRPARGGLGTGFRRIAAASRRATL